MNDPEGLQGLNDQIAAALFCTIASTAEGYISCIDRERRILFLNRVRSRPIKDIVGIPMDDFVAPEHRPAVIQCIEHAFETDSPQTVEFDAVLKQGEHRYLRTRVAPLRVSGGAQIALVRTDDLTEQRKLTEELERSVEFRRLVVEHLPDYVVVLDREHRFVWVNRFRNGLGPEDVLGKTIESFRPPGASSEGSKVIQAAFDTGAIGEYETIGLGEDGGDGYYLARVVPIVLDGKIDNVLLITSNITKRKLAERALQQTQEQLHRAQRLESLGQLAGGIAHDFNNLLQVIYFNLESAELSSSLNSAVRDELNQALRATERASELTSRLLAIGRRKQVDPKPVDLAELVDRSIHMLRRAIPENIRVEYQRPEEVCTVEVDAPEFEQVLINLCVNARDAMPNGGNLRVGVEAISAEEVLVRVSDTGAGIKPAFLSRIFEPFFTTKGAGSGLGLAIAAGIVAAHGGTLSADSDGRSGSIFTIRLPRVEATAEASPPQPSQLPNGQGVILLAEDEELVRTQLVKTLERAGYTVLPAENGARAVELYQQHGRRIDLALLDAIMPELDGWQTYLKLQELQPGIRALFTTGYAADVLPEAFQKRGAPLLSKPFKPQRLLEQVAAAIDRPGDHPRA